LLYYAETIVNGITCDLRCVSESAPSVGTGHACEALRAACSLGVRFLHSPLVFHPRRTWSLDTRLCVSYSVDASQACPRHAKAVYKLRKRRPFTGRLFHFLTLRKASVNPAGETPALRTAIVREFVVEEIDEVGVVREDVGFGRRCGSRRGSDAREIVCAGAA
jgi:hypothetical protein